MRVAFAYSEKYLEMLDSFMKDFITSLSICIFTIFWRLRQYFLLTTNNIAHKAKIHRLLLMTPERLHRTL